MDPLFEDDSMVDVTQDEDQVQDSFSEEINSGDQSLFETCHFNGETVDLPTEVCGNLGLFLEMLSPDLLSQHLSPKEIEHLQSYLPEFESNTNTERQTTWNMLFSKQNFKFGNPVETCGHQLVSGCWNPEIAQTKKLFLKAQRKNVKREQRNYYFNLVQNVIVSRQQLIETAAHLPPGQPARMPATSRSSKPVTGSKTNALVLEERVRKRYFDELNAIDAYSSEDENYPEGPLASLSKKQRRHLASIQASLCSDMKPIYSTLTQSIYNQSVTIDNKLDKGDDESSRNKIACLNDAKKGMEIRRLVEPVLDVLSRVSGSKNLYDINEETYKSIVNRHITLRRDGKPTPELELKDIRLEDIAGRVRLSGLSKRAPTKFLELTQEKMKELVSESSSSDDFESEVETARKPKSKKPVATKQIKTTPQIKAVVETGEVPITKELPCDIKTEPIEPDQPPPCLTQDTHPSFFALLREILISNDGFFTQKQIIDALVNWSTSPISPLNEWYSQLMIVHQRASGWSALVQSALEFLIDQSFTRSVSKQGKLTYSWIGQGKDSDALLQDLSSIWIQQQENTTDIKVGCADTTDLEGPSELNDSILSSPQDAAIVLGPGLDLGEETSDVGSSLFDSADIVHPPRSVTSWLVRPSSTEERALYQEQERQRYIQPHKAFTFRHHGYESIVGPVKGVYSPAQGVGQPGSKVRGHNLMVPDRPACVTLLSLVRDAAARLPNGEGTRADICELMKDSQYLSTGAEASLHSVVSGALDRLHYEADPCVKYDSGRKVWIYLHRHRSEAEFEQLHKQHQGMPSRAKKPRSEHRRSSGVGTSPVANKTTKTTAPVPVTSTVQSSTTPAEPQVSVLAPNITPIVKTVPKLSTTAGVVTVKQEPSGKSPAITVVATSPSVTTTSSAATIQTFQITTSTGIQTIRVAAPSSLPTALLARTLQLSAQQQSNIQSQKASGSPTIVNGTTGIKQVILSPPSSLSRSNATTLLANSRPGVASSGLSLPTSSASSIIRLNIPVSGTVGGGVQVSGSTRTRLPVNPVRLTGRPTVAATTTSSIGAPVQTFLIRPPTPSSTNPPTSTAPRLVMVNNKLINLSSTPVTIPNRTLRPNVGVAATAVRKTLPSSPSSGAARPVLARVVGTPGAQHHQQVITLENLLSLTNHQKSGSKSGVVQLPLSAIAGLNVATSSSTTTSSSASSSSASTSNQPTTVLLQNVKGAQSILLPAGFQGGTINIRGVRLANMSQSTSQPKQAFVARLVTPPQQQQQPPPPKNS